MSLKRPIVRFAPSPTGLLHVGSARTALFNWLYARKEGGTFILRIEDTDKERSTQEFERNILEGLEWLGLTHDALYRQSERAAVYSEHLEILLKSGHAYVSKEEGGERAEVIRFKNPGGNVTFTDTVRGDISFDVTELGDFVLAKSLTEPLYHAAVVIDDAVMDVTHIIRGEDGVSNTPRQILIQEALGAPRPHYTHLPLILAPDRSKLSKRHGAVAVTEYRDDGFLPSAVINFLALLGWSPEDDQELLSSDELLTRFRLERVQKAGAVFNIEKLRWFNREYLRMLPRETLLEALRLRLPHRDVNILSELAPLLLERISTLGEVSTIDAVGDLDYFFSRPHPERSLLRTVTHLPRVKELLEAVPDSNWNPESIKMALWDFATEVGRGEVLWPLRVALTGREKSPDPFTVAALVGKQETLARLSAVLTNDAV